MEQKTKNNETVTEKITKLSPAELAIGILGNYECDEIAQIIGFLSTGLMCDLEKAKKETGELF